MTVLRSGSATDVGRVRHSNQDVALEETDLYAVADGMGGHVGGEVAARVAIDALRESFRRHPTVEGLRRAVAEANEAVWRRSQDQTGLRGMGTTLTATALVAEADGRKVIALANVGDSRAYVFTRGRAIQVTADHSLAEEKVRQGELTEAEAAIHPHRHILTRALGVASDVDVDLWELHLHDGDRILLCSDGLTNEVTDGKIGDALGQVADPTDAARALVDAAVQHGGNDNVTVVVVDVLSTDDRLVSSTGTRRSRQARPPLAPTAGAAGGAGVVAGAAGGASETPPGSGASSGEGSGSGTTATATATATAPSSSTSATGTGTRVDAATPDRAAGARRSGNGGGAATTADAGIGSTTGPYRPPLGQAALHQRQREERRQRRRDRRYGGRWLTVRLVLFFVLVAAVVAAGYYFVRWYANDNWYVTLDGNNLAVYRGRPGGLLWFQPKLVERSSVTISTIEPYRLSAVKGDVDEPTLAAAKRYVANLHEEYVSHQQLRNGTPLSTQTSAPTTGPTTAPGGR